MPPVPGCRCPRCWTLREEMMELTGKDYGLPKAPGHAPPPRARLVSVPSTSMTDMDSDELAELQRRSRNRAKQPWDVAA